MALLMVSASCSDGAAPSGRGDGAPAHQEPAGSVVYLFPDHIPEGMELDDLETFNLPRGRREPGSYVAVVGRKQDDGSFERNVHVIVHEAKRDREISPDEAKTYEIVDVRGRPARFRDHELTGASLDWFSSGLAVGLIGPSGARRDVLAVGRALRLPRSGKETDVKLGRLPAGWTVVAERGVAPYRSTSYSFGSHTTEGAAVRSFNVSVSTFPEGTFAPVLFTLGSDHLRYIGLRDADAAISSSTVTLAGPDRSIDFESRSIAWLEYPDVLVTIIATGLAEEALIAIAEGLEEMSEQEWREGFPP